MIHSPGGKGISCKTKETLMIAYEDAPLFSASLIPSVLDFDEDLDNIRNIDTTSRRVLEFRFRCQANVLYFSFNHAKHGFETEDRAG